MKEKLVPDYLNKIPEKYDIYKEAFKLPENPTAEEKGHVVAEALIRLIEEGNMTIDLDRSNNYFLKYNNKKYSQSISKYYNEEEPGELKAAIAEAVGVTYDEIKSSSGKDYLLYRVPKNYLLYKAPKCKGLVIIKDGLSKKNIAAIYMNEDGTWEFKAPGQDNLYG